MPFLERYYDIARIGLEEKHTLLPLFDTGQTDVRTDILFFLLMALSKFKQPLSMYDEIQM